jgi:lysophospholipase L1-like esterase
VLGDSLSTGFHQTGFSVFPGSWDCKTAATSLITSGRLGWSCILRSDLRHLRPRIRVENLALNGEDSCSMIRRRLCGTGSPSRTGSPSYNIDRHSQLDAALAFLHAHPKQVSPITFEIGGNDGLVDPSGTVRQAVFDRLAANRDKILAKIRAAAPAADILLVGYPLPAPGDFAPRGVETQYEAMSADEARKYGALTVDLSRPTHYWDYPFRDTGTGHPSDTGQRQIAEIVWSDYQAYLHGKTPVSLTVKPSADHVPRGKTVSLSYSTIPRARVSLALGFKDSSYRQRGHADRSGHWQVRWSAPHHSGHVSVHACANADGASMCIDEFLVVT